MHQAPSVWGARVSHRGRASENERRVDLSERPGDGHRQKGSPVFLHPQIHSAVTGSGSDADKSP
jgi:hypothetical protein